ncbi:hypothetical protein GCM10007978_28680 [Shewanella hanedai]|jgi:hypothetical protein|nr:hypothetical protein [Shewanella hanedai]GGI89199.1 hypothetical protein GCM10007978_28680 [Shewanella hanedai]
MLRNLFYAVICYAIWLTYQDVSAYINAPSEEIAQLEQEESDKS